MNIDSSQLDLNSALEQLGTLDNSTPALFERVARWRRGCGDADGAATWQTWSLLPPEPEELERALAHIWLLLGDTNRAEQLLNNPHTQLAAGSWDKLSLLLKQNQLSEALALQDNLLRNPPELAVQSLLELAELWRRAEQPQQALDLLQPMLVVMQKAGEQPTAALSIAIANLLEQLGHFDQAEPWWQRSHSLQPQQTWPLMSLGRQALRRQLPGLAFHYASQTLRRDPEHAFAPKLQRKALIAMGAQRSLDLLDGKPPLEPIITISSAEPPPATLFQGCSEIALLGFSDAFVLRNWVQAMHAEDHDASGTGNEPICLWLIASPDPLWLQHEASTLLEAFDQTIELRIWPQWDSQRHGEAQLVLEASPESPGWTQNTKAN